LEAIDDERACVEIFEEVYNDAIDPENQRLMNEAGR